jgi:hypothetical protein
MTETIQESAELHLELRNPKHSKQYSIYLEEHAGSWRCRTEYGAIGAPLKPGSGIDGVSFERAKAKYDSLIFAKTGNPCSCCGGKYIEPSGDQPALIAGVRPPRGKRARYEDAPPPTKKELPPTFFPELLTPIEESEVGAYLDDPNWEMEEKKDGNRVAIWSSGLYICAFNRKGEIIPLPGELDGELRGKINALLDGEFVDGRYVAFDILRLDGTDLAEVPRMTRRRILTVTLAETGVEVIKTFTGVASKRIEYERLKAAGAEGVVFKRAIAGVMPGRQGLNVKRKFWKQATVRVCAKKRDDGKRSFGMEMWRDPPEDVHGAGGQWWFVGTCTLSKSAVLPKPGTFREVKYLYGGVGGSLVQPEDWGARTDVTAGDCNWAQLKHKTK